MKGVFELLNIDVEVIIDELEYAKTSVNWFGHSATLDYAIKILRKELPVEIPNMRESGDCPKCEYDMYRANYEDNYCPNCGQAIKWT